MEGRKKRNLKKILNRRPMKKFLSRTTGTAKPSPFIFPNKQGFKTGGLKVNVLVKDIMKGRKS